MQAVILAGGLGTRLKPVTETLPKALVDVQGKTLTEHVINLLKEAGVNEFFLSVGYLREKIKAYFKDGSEFGIKIRSLDEEVPLGTGGWMHEAKDLLHDDFFVVNGDNLFAVDLEKMKKYHGEKGILATIALTEVEDTSSFGIVDLEDGLIREFVEKPKPEDAPSKFANSGYYLFNEKIFSDVPSEEKFMLEKDLFPKLAVKGLLAGFPSSSQWFDTGTFERLKEVNDEWRK